MDIGRVRRGLGLVVAGVLMATTPSVLSAPVAAAKTSPEIGPVVSSVPAAALAITSAKPKVTGTLAVGSTLTAVPGKWSSKTKFSYQWLASGKSIKKATKSTYKLSKAEAGKQISVKVTGKLGASTASKTSSVTAKVMLVGTPKITGTAAVGSTLSVNRGTWTSGVKFSYVWLRDGLAVPGATASSYKVAASDAGHKLSVKLTGKRSGYGTVSKASAAVSVPGGVSPATPTISGMTMVGSTLMVNEGVWAQGTTFSYQWLRNGTAIAGATSMSYTLVADDVHQQLSAAVTGKLGSASETRTSPAVTITGEVSPTTPTIAGMPTVGSTLMASPGTWAHGTSWTYQWLRDGVAIPGATGMVYTLVAADGAQLMSVAVTGTLGSSSETRTSAALPISGVVPPTISGTAAVGSTLTAAPGAWAKGMTLTYQWLRAGVAITGATSPSYTLVAADLNQSVSVAVTGKLGSASETKASPGVAVGTGTLLSAVPTITGTARTSNTLTANPGTWTADTSFTYQWLADGSPITRGTASTLRLGYLEAGRTITVKLTGSSPGYDTVSKISTGQSIPFEGRLEVGVDIPAGTFAAPDSDRCAWRRGATLDDFGSYPYNTLVDYRLLSHGPALVTLRDDDPWFWSKGCGRWVPVEIPPAPSASFGDGEYVVGSQVLSGRYKSTGITESCSVYLLVGAGGSFQDDFIKTFTKSDLQTNGLSLPQAIGGKTVGRVTSENCGTWTRDGDLP